MPRIPSKGNEDDLVFCKAVLHENTRDFDLPYSYKSGVNKSRLGDESFHGGPRSEFVHLQICSMI